MSLHLGHGLLIVALVCLLAWWVHADQKWRRRGGIGFWGIVRVVRIGSRDKHLLKVRPAACIYKEARRQACTCQQPGCKGDPAVKE